MPDLQKKKSNLKASFVLLYTIQLILIIGLAILISVLYQNQNNLAKSRDTYFNTYLLADELRQSSDDLTRLARSYVDTNNPEFEREYWAVLDIRNGLLPRPQNYNRIYWDFVSASGQKPRPDDMAISLRDLILQENISIDEFDRLTIAQKKSDELVKIETVAMNAMKGLFADANGNFTIKNKPDTEMARQLMNSEYYYQIKSEIMKPIDEFYVLAEARTSALVQKYLNYAQTLFTYILLATILVMGIFLFSFIAILHQINLRETAQNELFLLNANLEKMIEERTTELKKSEDKAVKAYELTQQMNQFMVGRELKMVELKKQIESLRKES